MERSMLHIILSVLLLTPAVLSKISIDLNYDDDLKETMGKKYDIRGTIILHCKVTATESESFNVKWEKEGIDVKKIDPARYVDNVQGNSYGFKLSMAQEEDLGVYSCIVSSKQDNTELARANITMINKIRVKTTGSLNFIEGENIRIPCQVLGKPTPRISWKIGNETYDESADRVELLTDTDRKIEKAILFIKEAQMSDRGTYECIATPEVGNEMSSVTMVRIKDKYAALWPFLGICAEVFVLCAIILIYEKKRNKTELEESDTDQSPDQKNTPDHGKDTNLRHRQ